MIGCHPKTLRRLIAAGLLTGYRVGRAIRIDLDELYAALPPIPTVRQGNDR
jgi:excisionase family DNA binding protein